MKMIQFLIDEADKVKIDDIITVAIGNVYEPFINGIHFVGKVLAISQPHEDITEFKLNLFAHCDNKTGIKNLGVRHETKVAIIRKGE